EHDIHNACPSNPAYTGPKFNSLLSGLTSSFMFPEFLNCARPGVDMMRSTGDYEQKMARGAHRAQPLAGL
ncbi:MAG: hypothetical protein CBCREVIR_2918, partial [Candidatus Burkholderia crenata]